MWVCGKMTSDMAPTQCRQALPTDRYCVEEMWIVRNGDDRYLGEVWIDVGEGSALDIFQRQPLKALSESFSSSCRVASTRLRNAGSRCIASLTLRMEWITVE